MVWILLLSDVDLSTHALTALKQFNAFGVRQDLIGGEALASNRSLYLVESLKTLPLKAFRGVRAISKFDWSFGGEDSHLPYRYSFLHLLFPTLQQILRFIFSV